MDRQHGHRIAEQICPPYRAAIPAALLTDGENRLTVEVTNTLVKSHHNNPFDRYFAQDPTGLIRPVWLKRKN